MYLTLTSLLYPGLVFGLYLSKSGDKSKFILILGVLQLAISILFITADSMNITVNAQDLSIGMEHWISTIIGFSVTTWAIAHIIRVLMDWHIITFIVLCVATIIHFGVSIL